jgi:ribosomal protein L24
VLEASQKEHSKATAGEEVAQLPQPGDTVQILSGELAGQQGLVRLVDDTMASVQLSRTLENFNLYELHLVERCQLKVGNSVFVNTCPHTDKHGPYEIQSIDGAYAKVEMFGKLLLLADLRLAP